MKNEIIGLFRSLDVIVGHDSQDGSMILETLRQLAERRGECLNAGANREIGNLFLRESLLEYFPRNYDHIRKRIKDNYLAEGDFSPGFTGPNAETILTIYSDLLYASPVLAVLENHCGSNTTGGRKGSTYTYRFDLETQFSKKTNPVW